MAADDGRRIAFYAPLKAPTANRPSGDRRLARLFIKSLTAAGYTVKLASELRSFDGAGDAATQAQLRDQALAEAAALVRAFRASEPPDYWFSYHLYHKAPDWIGPVVATALNIPYVVAEASFAPKQATGPWQMGHEQVRNCLAHIDGLVVLNPVDLECVRPHLKPSTKWLSLPAQVDTKTFHPQPRRRELRREIADGTALDPAKPWLIAVAMMRPDAKLESYTFLARALARISDRTWQLIIVGDGAARPEVESAFAACGTRVVFLGEQDSARLATLYTASDLLVWPAINEAIGMALLEAQACGLPVVAGASGAVATVVADGSSGYVVDQTEAAFAAATASLLADPSRREAFGEAALRRVNVRHSIEAAAASLNRFLDSIAIETRSGAKPE